MTAKPKTPGFNHHMEVRFRVDRNGRPFADGWYRGANRWVRVSYDGAKMWVAQGLATQYVPS